MAAASTARNTAHPFQQGLNTQKLLRSSIAATKQPKAPQISIHTSRTQALRGSREAKILSNMLPRAMAQQNATPYWNTGRTQDTLTTSPAASSCRRRYTTRASPARATPTRASRNT